MPFVWLVPGPVPGPQPREGEPEAAWLLWGQEGLKHWRPALALLRVPGIGPAAMSLSFPIREAQRGSASDGLGTRAQSRAGSLCHPEHGMTPGPVHPHPWTQHQTPSSLHGAAREVSGRHSCLAPRAPPPLLCYPCRVWLLLAGRPSPAWPIPTIIVFFFPVKQNTEKYKGFCNEHPPTPK